MKKLLCFALSILLMGTFVIFSACDEKEKTESGSKVTEKQWEQAFSEEAFANVSGSITIGEGDDQIVQTCKIVKTSQRFMLEMTVSGGGNKWTEIYVEENGETVLYSNEQGEWTQLPSDMTIEEIMSVFNMFKSLSFENANYQEKEKSYIVSVAGGQVSVKFDTQKRLESISFPSGIVYRFFDYGQTEITLPVISDITQQIFENAVKATNYTLVPEIKYADEEKSYSATLWRQDGLYRMNIPYRIIMDNVTQEYLMDLYFKEEDDGIYILDLSNQYIIKDETWEKLSESDYNLFLVNNNASTIGEINKDFFPLYDYIPQLTYNSFTVSGNLLTAKDSLLTYFNGMSAYTNIQLSSLTVEFRGNNLYQIHAEAAYSGRSVSMKYTFSEVGKTIIDLPPEEMNFYVDWDQNGKYSPIAGYVKPISNDTDVWLAGEIKFFCFALENLSGSEKDFSFDLHVIVEEGTDLQDYSFAVVNNAKSSDIKTFLWDELADEEIRQFSADQLTQMAVFNLGHGEIRYFLIAVQKSAVSDNEKGIAMRTYITLLE